MSPCHCQNDKPNLRDLWPLRNVIQLMTRHWDIICTSLGDDRKSASWQKYLWFSFLKQILSMQVPLWRNTAISSCIEFMDKKFHAHLWESHCKDLFLYEIIMREPLQRFLFIWNNFFLGFWSWHNFLGSYQWMDAGKRKWLSPET